MSSIFSRIVSGEIPCHKVWEDEAHLAFLDIRPVQPGHTLVIPKKEQDYIFDLDEQDHAALWTAARKVAAHLKEVIGCERVCTAVLGYEVPHAHIHLIPTNAISDFPWPGGTEADVEKREVRLVQERDPAQIDLIGQRLVGAVPFRGRQSLLRGHRTLFGRIGVVVHQNRHRGGEKKENKLSNQVATPLRALDPKGASWARQRRSDCRQYKSPDRCPDQRRNRYA